MTLAILILTDCSLSLRSSCEQIYSTHPGDVSKLQFWKPRGCSSESHVAHSNHLCFVIGKFHLSARQQSLLKLTGPPTVVHSRNSNFLILEGRNSFLAISGKVSIISWSIIGFSRRLEEASPFLPFRSKRSDAPHCLCLCLENPPRKWSLLPFHSSKKASMIGVRRRFYSLQSPLNGFDWIRSPTFL